MFQYLKNLIKFFKELANNQNQTPMWKDLEYFHDSWNYRSAALYEFIRPINPELVYDFGCGLQFIRGIISPNSVYIPIDYKSRSFDTVICDLNNEFPNVPNGKHAAILSGVIEYIDNVESFIKKLSLFKYVAVSYCVLERHSNLRTRRSRGWVNDFYHNELVDLFIYNGFVIKNEALLNGNNLFLFELRES